MAPQTKNATSKKNAKPVKRGSRGKRKLHMIAPKIEIVGRTIRLNPPPISCDPRNTIAVITPDICTHFRNDSTSTSASTIDFDIRETLTVPPLIENDHRGPIQYICPVELTSTTALPPHTPTHIANRATWPVTDSNLRQKAFSSEEGPWRILLDNKHIAYCRFDIGDFSAAKQRKFVDELIKANVFQIYQKDNLTITHLISQNPIAHKAVKDSTMKIVCDNLPRFKQLKERMHLKYKVRLRLSIKRSSATTTDAGAGSVHFDDINKSFDWDLRCIGSFGSWLKLFGFTENLSKHSPIHMKLIKSHDFIIMDRKAAGSYRETGSKNEFYHVATLLPNLLGGDFDP